MGKRIYVELVKPRNRHGFNVAEGLLWLLIASGFGILLATSPFG